MALLRRSALGAGTAAADDDDDDAKEDAFTRDTVMTASTERHLRGRSLWHSTRLPEAMDEPLWQRTLRAEIRDGLGRLLPPTPLWERQKLKKVREASKAASGPRGSARHRARS
ncbi:hypothetical protein ISCGN_003494 [Ixodes scapularis]